MAAGLVFLGGVALPAAASARSSGDLAPAFELLGFTPAQADELAGSSTADPGGDGNTFPPNRASEPHDEPVADILRYGSALVTFGEPAFGAAANPTFPCGEVIDGEGAYVCAGEAAGLDGTVVMFWFETGAPVPLRLDDPNTTFNLNVATYSEGAERWSNSGEFEFDTFRGTNRWHEVQLTSEGWDIVVRNISVPGSEGTPVAVESSVFALVRGTAFALFVPAEELELAFDAGRGGSQAGGSAPVRLLGRGGDIRALGGWGCGLKRLLSATAGVSIMDACGDITRADLDLFGPPSGRPYMVDRTPNHDGDLDGRDLDGRDLDGRDLDGRVSDDGGNGFDFWPWGLASAGGGFALGWGSSCCVKRCRRNKRRRKQAQSGDAEIGDGTVLPD